jgi:hypothetical protein
MEPNYFKQSIGKKFENDKKAFNKDWRYKDVSIYMLRPMDKLTRRELKAVKELIENP